MSPKRAFSLLEEEKVKINKPRNQNESLSKGEILKDKKKKTNKERSINKMELRLIKETRNYREKNMRTFFCAYREYL